MTANAPQTDSEETHRNSRRGLLTTIATGITGLAAGCLDLLDGPENIENRPSIPVPGAESEHWLMPGHNAGASQHNPAGSIAEPSSTPTWEVSFPREISTTPPVLDGSRVYLGGSSLDDSTSKRALHARSLDDGGLIWSTPIEGEMIFTPTVAPEANGSPMVFAVSTTNTVSDDVGTVSAVDASTGDRLWEWEINRVLYAPIVVANETVLVRSDDTAGEPGAIHALAVADGTEQWRFPVEPRIQRAPTVADGTVFVRSGRGKLFAVALKDGTLRWERTIKAGETRPVVDSTRGLLLLGYDRGLEAYTADTGERVWEYVATPWWTDSEDFMGVIRNPVVTPQRLFVRTTDTSDFAVGDVGHCFGVDPLTGKQQWAVPNGRPASDPIGAQGMAILRRAPEAIADVFTWPYNEELPSDARSDVDMVAIRSDGTIAWEYTTLYAPVAVSSQGLLASREERFGESNEGSLAWFAQ